MSEKTRYHGDGYPVTELTQYGF